jgi:uncharacterized protein YbjT (DUF2867 family)
MRVIVFGASGATGRQLVGQALADGHQVTAFVRNVSRRYVVDVPGTALASWHALRLASQLCHPDITSTIE